MSLRSRVSWSGVSSGAAATMTATAASIWARSAALIMGTDRPGIGPGCN